MKRKLYNVKNLFQLGKNLSRDEQKSIVGGVRICAAGFKRACLIYGNPNPEYPDVTVGCYSCDDWSGMAGDQCREICNPVHGFSPQQG